jgi:hypothetical protein
MKCSLFANLMELGVAIHILTLLFGSSGSLHPTSQICRLTRRNVNVLLSGIACGLVV